MTVIRKPRSVITGGAGFIGSHLARLLLAEGWRVTVIDDLSTGAAENLPSECELIRGDVLDTEKLRSILSGVEAVFHLAAVPSVTVCQETPYNAHKINMGGTMAVIEAVRDAAPTAPILFASSAAVYGVPSQIPLTEKAEQSPLGFYGGDKLNSERALEIACRSEGLRAMALRLFNVYGERQDPKSPYSGVISIFAGLMLQRKVVTIFGNGKQTRDFIRAQDVATHFLAAANFLKKAPIGTFKAINVCTGRKTTINRLHELMAAHFDVQRLPRYTAANPTDIFESMGDRSFAKALLATGEPMPFREGLADYLASLAAQTE